jgi:hypothetical protein
MLRTLVVWLMVSGLALGGCPRKDQDNNNNVIDPSPEMESALTASNDALTATLVATDITRTVDDAVGSKPMKAGTCPEITREVGQIVIDYGTGCVPESGLVPGTVAGTITLDRDAVARTVTGSFDALTYDGQTLDGTVMASYTLLGGATGIDLAQAVDLTLTTGNATIHVTSDAQVGVRATNVTLDGNLSIDDGTTERLLGADGIEMAYADLATAACPLPRAGTLAVTWDQVAVTITFDADSPSTGYATVTSGVLSGDVPVCDYLGAF